MPRRILFLRQTKGYCSFCSRVLLELNYLSFTLVSIFGLLVLLLALHKFLGIILRVDLYHYNILQRFVDFYHYIILHRYGE